MRHQVYAAIVYGALLVLAAAGVIWIVASAGIPQRAHPDAPAYALPPPVYKKPEGAVYGLTIRDALDGPGRHGADAMGQYADTIEPPVEPIDAAAGAAPAMQKPEISAGEREMLAKTVWGEAGSCAPEEQALVVWTALNRLDDGRFGATIKAILTAPGQFVGYRAGNPVTDAIMAVVDGAADAYQRGEAAPILPPYAKHGGYLYFSGDRAQKHNWFK